MSRRESSSSRVRLPPPLLRRALLRPEPLLALLVLVAATVYFFNGFGGPSPASPVIEIAETQAPELETREVRLVRFDSNGLEAPTFASVALPDAATGRLQAIVAALREATLGEEWPEGLPAPTVFVESIGRESVAILDFRPEKHLPLTVEAEARLLASIRETLLANGADELRFLLDGEAAGVFLEHLAVPAAL